MFTGIIDHCGRIEKIEEGTKSLRIRIATSFRDLVEGESISVDGACLTVVSPEEGRFTCEVSPETMRLTISGSYREGRAVNLERALRLGDRLGGHFVMGHVDGKATVARKVVHTDYVELAFADVPSAGTRYLIPKGSVAVNGVSLTLNQVGPGAFNVMLIPHTLERTNLKELGEKSEVNLEFDWLSKVILHDRGGSNASLD